MVKEVALLGVQIQHRYARNYLFSEIYNTELRAGTELAKGNSHYLEAGIKYQKRILSGMTSMNGKELIPAGYSLPHNGNQIGFLRGSCVLPTFQNQTTEMHPR